MPDARENPGPDAVRHGPRIGLAVVRGRSMEPTLYDGDRLLVRYRATPRPGGLVVVRLPDRPARGQARQPRSTTDGWWVERDNPAEGVDSLARRRRSRRGRAGPGGRAGVALAVAEPAAAKDCLFALSGGPGGPSGRRTALHSRVETWQTDQSGRSPASATSATRSHRTPTGVRRRDPSHASSPGTR